MLFSHRNVFNPQKVGRSKQTLSLSGPHSNLNRIYMTKRRVASFPGCLFVLAAEPASSARPACSARPTCSASYWWHSAPGAPRTKPQEAKVSRLLATLSM